jgi:hypothetical protein
MIKLYAIHDHDPDLKRKGAFEITYQEIQNHNAEGYGIFMTVNDFNGRRKAENLEKINYWLADIDEGTKEEQLSRINSLPLKPTIIVETKKGYHCYWRAINATFENYREIEKGLIQRLNADKACTDVSRLLRFPTSKHMKDPNNPFTIKIIEQNDKAYTEEKMLCAYQLPKPKLRPVKFDGEKKDFLDETKWERIFKLSTFGEGQRNATFARYVFWLKDSNLSDNEISFVINGLNQKISSPLPQYEIDILLKSKGVL